MKKVAALILAAGRGTRMKDDSCNKVCFPCAGIPVIRRTVLNMKAAGITQFVVVCGYKPRDVMEALDGIEGIVYVYQRVQNGTGYATMLGLKALHSLGYSGSVIVSMGDKVIASSVIREYIELAQSSKAICGVQRSGINKQGGRIALKNDRPYGIVEFADIALMKIAEKPEQEWKNELDKLGISAGKAGKIIKKAKGDTPSAVRMLCGTAFSADELLNTPLTNVALYCFPIDSALAYLQDCTPQNAQGEIYVTDIIERYCAKDELLLYKISREEDILTYSTRPELVRMSRYFMRPASQLLQEETDPRIAAALKAFSERFGDKSALIATVPGRVNIVGRHTDFCGGNTNVMTIDKNTILVAAPRDDRVIHITNLNPAYPDYSVNIDEVLDLAPHSDWIEFIESEPVRKLVEQRRGEWINYIMGAVMRFQCKADIPLCGMDILLDSNIPVAAGLSSSSSIVVATAEAIVYLNCLYCTDNEFVTLCGEGEWFVGTRGGAGDHSAMKCSKKGKITQLGFKPFYVGNNANFSDKYAIVVVDSNIKSRKSAGSKDKFNSKVASYQLSFMLMKKYYPQYNMHELRDASALRPFSKIYRMLKRIPAKATREEIFELMPENKSTLERIFSNHADPGVYDLRGAALFGISECARSARCLELLQNDDYAGLGELMKISHNGDRVSKAGDPQDAWPMKITDDYLIECERTEADVALQPGAYGCSLPEIDMLCDMLNGTDGVLGSQMLGAGLGGCLGALVEKSKAQDIIDMINRVYYDKNGYPHLAHIYAPMEGSSVRF